MPQKIVETQSYPKSRECDVPVSNYATFGHESPSGSDSSLEDLFTNSQSSKHYQCETVNDKGIHSLSVLTNNDGICSRGNEDRDLDLPPLQMYGEYYVLNHKDKNKCNDRSQSRKFKSLPNKPSGSNMRLVSECEVLADGSLGSSPSIEPNGFSSKSNLTINASEVPKSNGFHLDLSKVNSNCPADESKILSDFSDLLSSISSPSMVSNGFSSSSNSYQDSPKVPNCNGFDHEFLKPSSEGSLKCEDPYSETKSGTLFDYFTSISFGDCSMRNGSTSSLDSDLFIKEVPIPSMPKLDPELSKANSNCVADDSKPSDYKSQNNGVLSDIFLSIDIEKDEPKRSKLNSPLQSSDSSLTFEDLFLGSEADGLKLNGYNTQTNETASNLFLPCLYENDAKQRKLESPILSLDTNLRLEINKVPISNGFGSNYEQTNSDTQVHGGLSDFLSLISPLECCANDAPAALNGIPKSDTQNALLTSLLDFDVREAHRVPTASMSVPKPTSIKSTMHNQKNGEFSFFSVSPENGFSDMVSKLKNDVDSQKNATDDNSTGISMLDLFKSVNSDSCSSLSEYLSSESEGSLADKNVGETEHDVWEKMDIDLSSCVKTNNDSLNIVPTKEAVMEDFIDAHDNDQGELQLKSFMVKAFPETGGLKQQRTKFKQGLFAKSLSCKLKKDPVLLQKVYRIKTELFEKYFNRPFPDFEDKKRVVKDLIVSQANNCMVTFNGRHVCTPKGLEDVMSN